ncbi:MAG: PP2C family protein-serine/threonine phosphatase [Paracoccaceae bacterium]
MQRILIVDDSRLQRRIISRLLRKWGFEVVEAECGEDALDQYAEHSPEMVISDWMMPGMNGLDLCRALRADSNERYCYFILLTSKSDKGEIAQGLDAGSDDFVTKPVDPVELRARITAGDRILSMQNELSEKNAVINETLDQLREAYDKIDNDLQQARKIQQSLVPERNRRFGRSEISLLLKPCGHIGGDLVGMFSPGSNRLAFYSIDVSGHGITSAMMTARLGSYLSSRYLDQNVGTESRFEKYYALLPPTEVARRLNQRLTADQGIDEYFTMVYCTADLKSGTVRLLQAGHPHPLIIRKDGSYEFVGEGGLPIGLVSDVAFSQIELKLQPGDRLLLYSDGITECRRKSGEMIEEEGLKRLVSSLKDTSKGQDFLDDLFWALSQEMCPDTGLDDDVSALLFEFNGP